MKYPNDDESDPTGIYIGITVVEEQKRELIAEFIDDLRLFLTDPFNDVLLSNILDKWQQRLEE